jgi:hypothetical protein
MRGQRKVLADPRFSRPLAQSAAHLPKRRLLTGVHPTEEQSGRRAERLNIRSPGLAPDRRPGQ